MASVTFSPDGAIVAAGRGNGSILLRDVATGEPLRAPLEGHATSVSSVAFNADRSVLAAGGEDGTIRLWASKGTSWEPYGPPLQGTDSAVASLAFSPDGTILAAGSGDGSIDLWPVNDLEPMAEPAGRMTFASWREHACNAANRNFTCSEWKLYMGDEPYRATCPELAPSSTAPCQ